MYFKTEFADETLARNLVRRIHENPFQKPLKIMEVCGTHTMAVARFGIKNLLPRHIKLLSGPGCPVCVTPNETLDRAIAMSRSANVILVTFGDMLRVPGTQSSLAEEKRNGADIRILYSATEALAIAHENPDKKVVFLGVGFETTAPTAAALLEQAIGENLKNLLIFSAFKTIPNALLLLVRDEFVGVDGFMCPGHVSAITGIAPYLPVAEDYKIPCVVAGFEKTDILQAVYMLLLQLSENRSMVEVQYSRVVKATGNSKAQALMYKYFGPCDSVWRGLGVIPGSGLSLRQEVSSFDAVLEIPVSIQTSRENPACHCGFILRGVGQPSDCPLFGEACLPENPVGPCMVSNEGACAAAYRYEAPNPPNNSLKAFQNER